MDQSNAPLRKETQDASYRQSRKAREHANPAQTGPEHRKKAVRRQETIPRPLEA